jgi:hypothetical protein
MFIGLHGSWNRRPPSGYKVVFVPFGNGMPSGMPVDVLTGFLHGEGRALGRPVGVAIDRRGGLLVADDVGNKVWRVADASPRAAGVPRLRHPTRRRRCRPRPRSAADWAVSAAVGRSTRFSKRSASNTCSMLPWSA